MLSWVVGAKQEVESLQLDQQWRLLFSVFPKFVFPLYSLINY